MEGINEKDYCPKCGEKLHYLYVSPKGIKRVVCHEIDSQLCKDIKEFNERMLIEDGDGMCDRDQFTWLNVNMK